MMLRTGLLIAVLLAACGKDKEAPAPGTGTAATGAGSAAATAAATGAGSAAATGARTAVASGAGPPARPPIQASTPAIPPPPPRPTPAPRATRTTPATAAAPPTTCSVGEPVVLASAARTPGPLDVAVHGDRTAVAVIDGGKAYVIVADAAGAAVAPAVELTGGIKETHLLASPTGFVVVTVQGDKCVLQARTLDVAGQLGAPTQLDKDVCNPFAYPQVTIRDGQVLALVTHTYEGEGIDVVRWRDGGAAEVTKLVPRSRNAAPAAVAATATGYAVLWQEGSDPMDLATTRLAMLDAAGVAATPTKVTSDDDQLALIGAMPVMLRVRAGSLELRGKTWNKLGPSKADKTPGLTRFAGRSWAIVLSLGIDPTLVVPLDDDGAPVAAGFTAPSNALDHDGRRGATASWRSKPRELLLHPLTCTGA